MVPIIFWHNSNPYRKITFFLLETYSQLTQRWIKYFSFCESGIKVKYFLPIFTSFEKVSALNTVWTQMKMPFSSILCLNIPFNFKLDWQKILFNDIFPNIFCQNQFLKIFSASLTTSGPECLHFLEKDVLIITATSFPYNNKQKIGA